MAARDTSRDYPTPGAYQCDLGTVVGLATRHAHGSVQPLGITAKDRETSGSRCQHAARKSTAWHLVRSVRAGLLSPARHLSCGVGSAHAQKVGNAMSTFVVLEFQAKPDKVEAVKEFLRQVLPDTRNYAGYESLVLQQNQDDPTSMMMYEQWSTRPHYDAYLAWRIDTGALAEFAEMLAGPPSFRFFDLVDA